MKECVINLERETKKNTDFRRVLYTTKHSQLVLMSLKPGEEIGEETHNDGDQFFRFEAGEGKVIIDGLEHRIRKGNGVIVIAGASHNVINTSKRKYLKLYTIYSPPERHNGIVRHIKNRHTTDKHRFPETLMEDMREAYRRNQQYLQTMKA